MNTGENIFYNSAEKRLKAFWRILIQFVLFVGAYMLPVLFLDLFESPFIKVLVDEFLTLGFVFVIVWFSVKFLDKRKLVDIGLKLNKNWFSEFGQGLIIGALIFLLIFLIEMSLSLVEVKNINYFDSPGNITLKLVFRFAGFFCVALMEEMYSRGYQLKNIAEGLLTENTNPKLSVIYALVLSSVVFGLMHGYNPNVSLMGIINLALIGLFYGYAYIATGSLAMPVGIHTTWNFIQGNILGFPVSGMAPKVSMLSLNQSGSYLFTGGEFGPEGGAIVVIGVIAGVLSINYITTGNFFKFSVIEKLAYYKKA